MKSHTVTAVLFDVDGTLVDSNDAHAQAWVQAFAAHGVVVDYTQVRRCIGMGGDKLMPRRIGSYNRSGPFPRASRPSAACSSSFARRSTSSAAVRVHFQRARLQFRAVRVHFLTIDLDIGRVAHDVNAYRTIRTYSCTYFSLLIPSACDLARCRGSVRLFRVRRIDIPQAMPHTQNF